MARVLLAEDQALIREGFRRILESNGHEVVGMEADGLKVADLVASTRPDLLLLDLGLPGLHGLDVLRSVKRRAPSVRVLVLSGDGRDEFVVQALRLGAAGYLLKGSDVPELLEAIREVVGGGFYISPRVSGSLAMRMGDGPAAAADPYDDLTAREREVFHLIAEGLTNAAIGERLFISPRTVETHRANLMRKLRLRTQTEIVLYALRRGILNLDG